MTGDEKYQAFKSIVERRAYDKVDGYDVDMQTANAVVTVCDGLNPTNRAKLLSSEVPVIVMLAWKLIEKTKGGAT